VFLVVVLAAAGVFLIFQGLERADQWAGASSFLVALGGAGAAAIAALRPRRGKEPDAMTQEKDEVGKPEKTEVTPEVTTTGPSGSSTRGPITIVDSTHVSTGDNAVHWTTVHEHRDD
jgi:hypothetical protein